MFYSKSSSFAVFCKKWFSYPVSSIFVFLICRRTEFPKPSPIQEIEMSITPFCRISTFKFNGAAVSTARYSC